MLIYARGDQSVARGHISHGPHLWFEIVWYMVRQSLSYVSVTEPRRFPAIGVAMGGKKGHVPPKFLTHLNVLCFETQCPKPTTVARLNSKPLPPPKILGWRR